MKTIITSATTIFLVLLFAVSVEAQSSKEASTLSSQINSIIADNAIPGAQLGSVICEDAEGNKIVCSGKMEESILGIVTNVPYVTLNKPVNAGGSKYIFDSFVSTDNGLVNKGDFLVAGLNGNFVKTEVASLAYAIALETVESGQRTIKVKVLK
jgi:hypothetical protein